MGVPPLEIGCPEALGPGSKSLEPRTPTDECDW